ncbi:hypothetical protein TIFTF001_030025 [Ficus carica]|uniref:Uncharacterized protein n=1 Tax=Ficus carica TaxID=3494 RepID=A0AA88J290_FICCA|nr:hypothetical protein TIFTF001_030025 [Ficus carica]
MESGTLDRSIYQKLRWSHHSPVELQQAATVVVAVVIDTMPFRSMRKERETRGERKEKESGEERERIKNEERERALSQVGERERGEERECFKK